MRISDWSSDVCSSDLYRCRPGIALRQPLAVARALLDGRPRQAAGSNGVLQGPQHRHGQFPTTTQSVPPKQSVVDLEGAARQVWHQVLPFIAEEFQRLSRQLLEEADRKRVVSGKSVYARVDLGGPRVT